MEEFSDVRFKQGAVIEFLTAEKVPPIEIHRRMQAVYGDLCVDVSAVRRWVRRFKDGELGQADLSDKTGSGRPVMDFKNYCSIGGSVLKCVVILYKNNYAALKIIDVSIFLLFISLEYLFLFIFYLSGGKTYQPALILLFILELVQ